MQIDEYVKEHTPVCNATKRVGISLRRARIVCARQHYKHQLKRGFPLNPLRSYKEQ